MDWPTPRSAYVHVPFCRHRCGYCNFSVVADRDDLMQRYLVAIDHELELIARRLQRLPIIDTLFVGGGTPTHLPNELLETFLQSLRRRFEFAEGFEWTMEANPEDISDEKLSMMSGFGVNRLSLGVQSFNDRKLAVLERSHSGQSAEAIVQQAAQTIPNVSIDLIFAAPGETLSSWARDLRTAAALPITHVSTYSLTYEKGTSFWTRQRRGDLSAVDESVEITMYDLGRRVLAEAGLAHYEISNFAKPGFRCRHNLAYWRGDGWFAAGPGAAAFIDGVRATNHRSTTTYLKRIESGDSAIAESETISAIEAAREGAAFGVRMIDGVDLSELETRTGIAIETLCAPQLDELQSQGLIDRSGRHIKLTPRGIHFADTVASELLG
ncbi:Oxygen-independent coproporphyrinogen-III oxidase-like protein [Stieleria neptunia]|uniref:Heme chaperone HemW n=1 Tax=Stieleria neptunia TaxID=2527979 RepID=A0A518I3Y5_9BACT|nr:radical SAM family heme chaperone HemW [Stieleria neptunia]QDV47821.1 Oxygen-independent coproporphyrinogen-III oxidase-like protein [Stieleria neptunia]